MSYRYTHFIKYNIAPIGARKIGVYDSKENRIGGISLGGLKPVSKVMRYTFGLVSDMHLYKFSTSWDGNTKFDNALTYFEEQGCLFCAHCGDITQTGFYDEGDKINFAPAQFESYKAICDKHSIPVYGICGNHESYENPITDHPEELKYYTGTDLSYTLIQGNDLFIFLGQPHYDHVMRDSDLQWLYETLEANRNQRCFVFIHSYIEGDSGDPCGYRENSTFDHFWGESRTAVFKNLMQHYKNTILFHGHSHMKYECQRFDKNATYTEKNGFRSVHVPSLGKPRDIDPDHKSTPEDYNGSQGYTVSVYDDCIVLNGMDMISKEPVLLGQYRIDTPLQAVEANTFSDPSIIIKSP